MAFTSPTRPAPTTGTPTARSTISTPTANATPSPTVWRFPNGIVIRPSGKELLVAESRRNRILKFPVLKPGTLGPPRILIELPQKGDGQIDNQPDGIALDAAGNLFVAHYGMRQVQVVSPEGKLIRRYRGGNLTTSNVAFAGPEMDQLYLTGGDPGALFRLDLPGAKGLVILPQRSSR